MTRIFIGYGSLIGQFDLNVIPHYRSSFITGRGRGYSQIEEGHEIHVYPKTYALRDMQNPFQHIEFALKYDGLNLEIMSQVLGKISKSEIEEHITKQPFSKYSRMIWFLYEFLLDDILDIQDCKGVRYIDVLDPKIYFTAMPIKSARHGLNNNLPGNKNFCPIIRRTVFLDEYINRNLDVRSDGIIKNHDPRIMARAGNYLYIKETMSSYEIERERPDKKRMVKFIEALQKAPSMEELTRQTLIDLQNMILDPRFAEKDFRSRQNYVGENINHYHQKIHYISPKPGDVADLVDGLLDSLKVMQDSRLHPVIVATAIAFGFVFIHPFEDGNGRLHRFLIHYILSKNHFTPENIIFPVSAVMLQNIRQYDAVLELFSRPLLRAITEYDLSDDGQLTVKQATKCFYKYIDYTRFAEYLFVCIEETVNFHLKNEIDFLTNYDLTRMEIQNIVDMPDKLIDLFIRCVMQNNGYISKNKKQQYFEMLTDVELEELTKIVNSHMLNLA